MIYALLVALIAVMLVAAVFALRHRKLVLGVVAAGLVSLIASVIFVLLAAPDVAMTEAAIGSGLSTLMFLYVLNKVRGGAHG